MQCGQVLGECVCCGVRCRGRGRRRVTKILMNTQSDRAPRLPACWPLTTDIRSMGPATGETLPGRPGPCAPACTVGCAPGHPAPPGGNAGASTHSPGDTPTEGGTAGQREGGPTGSKPAVWALPPAHTHSPPRAAGSSGRAQRRRKDENSRCVVVVTLVTEAVSRWPAPERSVACGAGPGTWPFHHLGLGPGRTALIGRDKWLPLRSEPGGVRPRPRKQGRLRDTVGESCHLKGPGLRVVSW